MSRPTKNTIIQGIQSWDAPIDDNFTAIFDGPFPPHEAANYTALALFPPASHDRCVASQTDLLALVMSDGTKWSQLLHAVVGSGNPLAFGSKVRLEWAEQEVTLIAGAAQTVVGVFPAGCVRLGLTGRVTEIITGTVTDLDVGDGSDVDLYDAALALASGSDFDGSDHTASPLGFQITSAGDVVFTANGGTFDGVTGKIRLVAFYLILDKPTS